MFWVCQSLRMYSGSSLSVGLVPVNLIHHGFWTHSGKVTEDLLDTTGSSYQSHLALQASEQLQVWPEQGSGCVQGAYWTTTSGFNDMQFLLWICVSSNRFPEDIKVQPVLSWCDLLNNPVRWVSLSIYGNWGWEGSCPKPPSQYIAE